MAAEATGARDFRLLVRHLLPNAIPPIFVVVAVDLAVVIMLEATLSFLGVGAPLTEPSPGMMIAIGKNYVYAGMWWMVLFPGAALIFLVVGINLFADWLREELNPKIGKASGSGGRRPVFSSFWAFFYTGSSSLMGGFGVSSTPSISRSVSRDHKRVVIFSFSSRFSRSRNRC